MKRDTAKRLLDAYMACTERIPLLATAVDALLTKQYPDWGTYRSDRHEPD